MKSSKNIFNNIKSKYCLNILFNYIDKKRKLKIIQINKKLRSLLNIGDHLYIFNNIYNQLDNGEQIKIYYNENDDNSILNLIEKIIKNKEKRKKILIEFFKDLYYNYNKDLIIYYNAEFYSNENMKFLLSLNSPIKIYVIINLIFFNKFIWFKDYEKSEKNKNYLQNKRKKILGIFKYYKNIYGFNFEIKSNDFIDYEEFYIFLKLLLNKLNIIFPNIEYIRIPCQLISDLFNNDLILFFKNNLKIIDIYEYFSQGYEDFCILLKKKKNKIKEFLKTDILKIDLSELYCERIELELDLNGIVGIKSLELIDIGEAFSLDEKTIKSLNSLLLFNSPMSYFGIQYIKFPNLISLNISENYLDEILGYDSFDSNSFLKLRILTVNIISNIDYIILNKLLISTPNLIELNISGKENSISYKEEIEYEYYFQDFNEVFLEINEENYKKAFIKIYKKLANTILNLKNLQKLTINDFKDDFPFIDIIFDNYSSKNLNEFQSNYCIKLSSAKKFLINNKNLKKFSFIYNKQSK